MADITTFPIPTEVLDPANYPEFVGPTGATGATGATGPQGETGPAGADGADGVGVPAGGTTGQVLAKASATDYATEWVDQSGGGGSPGGSDTQVQFNDGGAFGGDAGLAFNKTSGSLTVGGKTVTTTAPVADLTQTWNASGTTFTGFNLNVTDTASAAGSLLADFQVGGVSKFSVGKTGAITIANGSSTPLTLTGETFALALSGSAGTPAFRSQAFSVGGGANELIRIGSNAANVNLTAAIVLTSTTPLAWVSSATNAYSSSPDITLFRDAANSLAQRNGVNAQTFRLYNTYTDASNYERGFMRWNSNVLEIGAEGAGTGASRSVRALLSQATKWTFYVQSDRYMDIGFTGTRFTINNPITGIDIGANQGVVLGGSGVGGDTGIIFGSNGAVTVGRDVSFSLTHGARISDIAAKDFSITGAPAWASATTNIIGGSLNLTAGAGASASSGEANGGNVTIRGGTGYGTGRNGLIIMDNLPTSNPGVAGALWNNLGVLSVSAG